MTEKTTSFKSTLTERAMIERMAQKLDRSLTWVIIESIRQMYKRTFGGAK